MGTTIILINNSGSSRGIIVQRSDSPDDETLNANNNCIDIKYIDGVISNVFLDNQTPLTEIPFINSNLSNKLIKIFHNPDDELGIREVGVIAIEIQDGIINNQ